MREAKYTEAARRLRQALDNKGMKSIELANKADISRAFVSQCLSGTASPSNITANKMAKVLGCDPLWLMGFDIENVHYENEDAAKIAQMMLDRPELKALMDASKNATKEDIEQITELIRKLSK